MKKLIFITLIFFCSTLFAQLEPELKKKIKNEIAEIKSELIKIRRHIHQYPELGNREFKTAKLVAEELKNLGFQVKEKVAHTGVIGILEGKVKGRVVAVRADMDALPIQEDNNLPFKSKIDGVMHACGHDVHTTIGLGTAKVLSELRNQFNGTVKFLFQPAEEGHPEGEKGGADFMVEEGALKNPAPEIIFGLHVASDVEVGNIEYVPKGALASNDQFEIIIQGEGSHAASPWRGVDPIVISANVITAIQNIRSRMTDTRNPLVISVGIIEGGTAFNIIPDKVKLVGTIRTHNQELRGKVKKMLKKVVTGICNSMGAEAEIAIYPGAPVTYNNPELTEWSVNIFKDVFGEEKVNISEPSMGAEDFAYYTLEIPAFFYWLGVANKEKGYVYPVHNPKFKADEGAIEIGVEAMCNLVINFLKGNRKF